MLKTNNLGLINKSRTRTLLVIALVLVLGNRLYPQNAGHSGQLGAEIQNLEQKLSQTGISLAERHDTLVRLARLLQLSGDVAGSAARWLEAAAVDPTDDNALISAAYCLAAIGEWEKALLALRPLLISGRRGSSLLQTRYLDASLKARIFGDTSPLADLAQDPEFADLRPLIYYTLWQIIAENPNITTADSAELWKSRLLAEYPLSPEARAANPENADSVSVVQNPIWMLPPETVSSSSVEPLPIPAAPVPAPAPTPAPSTGSTASVTVLQTGVFSVEANARAQSDALQRAGFSASISRKTVNNAELWAVTVAAGQDYTRTMQELERAGFDSFPVRN